MISRSIKFVKILIFPGQTNKTIIRPDIYTKFDDPVEYQKNVET